MQGATARVYDYYYARPHLQSESEANPEVMPQPVRKAKSKAVARPGRRIFIQTGVMLFVLSLLLVFLCARALLLNYQIRDLERENSVLETERLRLEYSISQQQSLPNIENRAVNELNMIKPADDTNYVVSLSTSPVMVAESETIPDTDVVEAREENILARIYQSIVRLAAGHESIGT